MAAGHAAAVAPAGRLLRTGGVLAIECIDQPTGRGDGRLAGHVIVVSTVQRVFRLHGGFHWGQELPYNR